jgi:hypothetical protein
MLRLCSDTDEEKTPVLEETTLPVPLCPPQILHGLAWDWKTVSTTHTIAWPYTPPPHTMCSNEV